MSHKALITRRDIPRPEATAMERDASEKLKLKVEFRLPHGTLVSGTKEKFAALEKQGYRVKLLLDTNILSVGSYRIDIEAAPPKVPPKLEVPKPLKKTWQHHLVQLAGPSTEEWIHAIEEHDVEVVETISAYGLFVIGNPEEVNKLINLPFVVWVGPFEPAYRIAPDLQRRKGEIQYVNVGIYSEAAVQEVRRAVKEAGGIVIKDWGSAGSYRDIYNILIIELDAKKLADIACLPDVRWLEYQSPILIPEDERSCQIVAENLDGVAPPLTAPVVGYQATLAKLGLSGTGVIIGLCDTGVCNNVDDATMHPDLQGRMKFFVDMTGGKTLVDGWIDPNTGKIKGGHGTHVAGIAVGNAATGEKDSEGFLLGQGVAPGANFGVLNTLDAPGTSGTDPVSNLTQLMVNHGAHVMNNSWQNGAYPGYTAKVAEIDKLVRDPNPNSATLEKLVIVFAAGNEGPQPKTITQPHEGKNTIIVGNSMNKPVFPVQRSEDIRWLVEDSSRGPADDGRILPTIVAPGRYIVSTRSTADADPNTPGVQRPLSAFVEPSTTVHADYASCSGTSMAAPHVSGLCALLIEWWRKRTGGRNPSPALLKALLINGAEDLAGDIWYQFYGGDWKLKTSGIFYTLEKLSFEPVEVLKGNSPLTKVFSENDLVSNGQQWFFDSMNKILFISTTVPADYIKVRYIQANIPNNDQGWGRVSLPNIVLQFPDSDRGPKIFSDQRHAFTANGQEYKIRVSPIHSKLPLRVTLVWTDGPGAANANPALVNDLDLEVTEQATGKVYKGNVFGNGFSTTGGNFDHLNNIECVYIQNPNGIYDVRVIAGTLKGNALDPNNKTTFWQDFAMVIDNAEVPSAMPVSVVPVIDRSGSMIFFGYENITKISSKQFVDLMSVDGKLGVASFSDDGVVEYPSSLPPTLQTITGQPIRDAAKTEIDSIVFGGCTYMGDGILKGKDLISSASGSRAMVLFSDGYDNKGCDWSNPNKPSALDAVPLLPPNIPVYTCAMGPASDQKLLEQIASLTKGRYYYMPAIDDLFEIYNYIRGQVTGDSIVANESAFASNSRVGAFVDVLATETTFTVAWADTKMKLVSGDPRKSNEVSIRLRDPRGQLLYSNISYLQRIEGDGYVIFKLQEPMPGQWFVEVSTAEDTHIRYTVGGFVRSPLQLQVFLSHQQIIPGMPLTIAAQVLDDKQPIKGFKGSAGVIAPLLSIPGLLTKYKNLMKQIRLPSMKGDQLPPDIAKLSILRNKLLKEKKLDIFAHTAATVPLRNTTIGKLINLGMGHLLTTGLPGLSLPPSAISGVLTGQFTNAKQQGSYNVAVTVNGISPVSNTRFVRKELVSVLAK